LAGQADLIFTDQNLPIAMQQPCFPIRDFDRVMQQQLGFRTLQRRRPAYSPPNELLALPAVA
jgi:hypothetical protein